MKGSWFLLLALALAPSIAAPRFDIAITIDDLPAHGSLPMSQTRSAIAASTIATLKAHGVPEAFGFVNGAKLAGNPDAKDVLMQWRRAGYPLGNHTFSHMNLVTAATLEAWQADVEKNEAVIAPLMRDDDWHYLRLPNLSAGDEGARRDGAMTYLAARGYRIADVSVAFSDWDYTDGYARCVDKGDHTTIAQLKTRYLKGVDDGIARMKAVSTRVYGRTIPQILLLHVGAFTAEMLPETLSRLETAGAHYVRLTEVLADPAYAQPGGGSVMERKAKANGISLGDIVSPASAKDVRELCR